MEVLRTRLCEWRPAGVDALALAPPGSAEPRLAVGRSNGVIELWDTTTWTLHSCTAGHAKRNVRGLVWLPNEDAEQAEGAQRALRLFSAGLHKELTEWDPMTLVPLDSLDAGGGPIWSLASAGGKVFAACEDGTVRIFSTKGGPGSLALSGRLNVGKTRLLSVAAFGTDHIFAGSSAGRISKWSLRTRTCDASMQVDGAKGAEGTETCVWALVALGDHGVASGDSLGVVQIWDPIACVVRHRFAQHQADVLALVASADGNALLSSGMDAVVSVFTRQPDADERWMFRNLEFGHTHDVRALVLDAGPEGPGPFIAGSVTGALRVHPIRLAAAGRPSGAATPVPRQVECGGLSPFLQTASVAQSSRLLLCQRDAHLELWYLRDPRANPKAPPVSNGIPDAQHVVRVSLEGAKEGRFLSASAIAPDGRHFAASDDVCTRLFAASLEELEVRRVKDVPHELRRAPARALLFCSSTLLAIAPRATTEVVLFDVGTLTVVATFADRHRAPVFLLAASSGGEWLASADLAGAVHVFSLDSLQHQARVPVGGGRQAFPTALAFDAGRSRLVVALSTRSLVIFDVEAQTLAAGLPPLIQVPNDIVPTDARICGVVSPPGTKDKLLLWGHGFLAKLAILAPAAGESTAAEQTPKKKAKAKQGGDGASPPEPKTALLTSPHAEAMKWQRYPGMEHIVALCALDESQWGGPVTSASGGGDADAEGQPTPTRKRKQSVAVAAAATSAEPKRAMVLTMEVSPAAIKKSLPPAFERKHYSRPATA